MLKIQLFEQHVCMRSWDVGFKMKTTLSVSNSVSKGRHTQCSAALGGAFSQNNKHYYHICTIQSVTLLQFARRRCSSFTHYGNGFEMGWAKAQVWSLKSLGSEAVNWLLIQKWDATVCLEHIVSKNECKVTPLLQTECFFLSCVLLCKNTNNSGKKQTSCQKCQITEAL